MHTNKSTYIQIIAIALFIGLLAAGYYFSKKDKPEPAQTTSNLEAYSNPNLGISLAHPKGYTINEMYTYEGMGPGKTIRGISLTIPSSYTQGKNLSADTRISIERLPASADCSASEFLATAAGTTVVVENNTRYSIAEVSDAAAGNRYYEKVYALSKGEPCVAVRYFIHSTNIGNYEPGTVTEFDMDMIKKEFDAIRYSLTVEKGSDENAIQAS